MLQINSHNTQKSNVYPNFNMCSYFPRSITLNINALPCFSHRNVVVCLKSFISIEWWWWPRNCVPMNRPVTKRCDINGPIWIRVKHRLFERGIIIIIITSVIIYFILYSVYCVFCQMLLRLVWVCICFRCW